MLVCSKKGKKETKILDIDMVCNIDQGNGIKGIDGARGAT